MEILSEISTRDDLLKVLNVAIDKIYKQQTSKKFDKYSTDLDHISKVYVQYCSNQMTKEELLEYFPVQEDMKDCVLKAIEVRKPQVCQHLLKIHNASTIPLMTFFDWDLKFLIGNSSLASRREQRATLMLNCLKGESQETISVELTRPMLDRTIEELEKQVS